MFEKLKIKWNVNTTQLVLILCTFALGGSTCGYLGRKVLRYFSIDNDVVFVFAYVIVITLLWPICVLLISIPLGQFTFFYKYLKKVKQKIFG